jgi:hypothetical protein
MTLYKAPLCPGCTHYRTRGTDPNAATNTGSCDAFSAVPNGIPVAIWHSESDHRRAYPGDNGIRFEPRDAEMAAYAELLFTPHDDAPDDGDDPEE